MASLREASYLPRLGCILPPGCCVHPLLLHRMPPEPEMEMGMASSSDALVAAPGARAALALRGRGSPLTEAGASKEPVIRGSFPPSSDGTEVVPHPGKAGPSWTRTWGRGLGKTVGFLCTEQCNSCRPPLPFLSPMHISRVLQPDIKNQHLPPTPPLKATPMARKSQTEDGKESSPRCLQGPYNC